MSTLVIFARAPVLGEVKRRLATSIGDAAALALYEAFLDDTCALTQGLGARRQLAVDGPINHPMMARLGKSQRLELCEQGAGDLGAKMSRFVDGSAPVVILGSDAPTLPRAFVSEALSALMEHEVVLGPSEDGGYYLIGATVPVPELFAAVPWSTPDVLPLTLARLRGRSHALLPSWYDVDSGDDLRRLESHLAELPRAVAPATRRALAALER